MRSSITPTSGDVINPQNIGTIRHIQRTLVGHVFNGLLTSISKSAQYLPKMRKRLKTLEIIKDVSYGSRGKDHLLDVYLPKNRDPQRTYPAIFYVHGGGFRILSKETHWSMALRFAEEGYIVFNINYRLAPQSPCPAALEDAALALEWLLDHGASYGVDLNKVSLAGESAGGNLVTALALCLCRPIKLPWAQRLFQRDWMPMSILPACGFLHVSGAEHRRDSMHPFILSRVEFLAQSYLKGSTSPELADPLLELESNVQFERPLPPFFITAGTSDPIYKDSERLHWALKQRGVDHRLVLYPRGVHAFHAFIWHPLAERCWRDHFEFLSHQHDRVHSALSDQMDEDV